MQVMYLIRSCRQMSQNVSWLSVSILFISHTVYRPLKTCKATKNEKCSKDSLANVLTCLKSGFIAVSIKFKPVISSV